MAFSPVQKLMVRRRTLDGQLVDVGVLAQNRQGVFFQYRESYLSTYGNLSPFTLKADLTVQAAPKTPHLGLNGVFADALPDGWGLLLQDRVFRQHGILLNDITQMDRLAFVGNAALGALSFSPISEHSTIQIDSVSLNELGINAQQIYDGQTEDVLSALVAGGSSGGARPKAQIYFNGDNFNSCRTFEKSGDDAWIVKFTSKNLSLGHEEGQCEAVYLTLAKELGLNPPKWKLLNASERSGTKKWLAIKRFDFRKNSEGKSGRFHMHSACGLLDADFRSPSLDYDDLIKASSVLCKSPALGQIQFRRAMFNLVFLNQDDHSKNWAFLQDDEGQWQPAPFYDVTYSSHPFGGQATSFSGFAKMPPTKALQKLAQSASYRNWQSAKEVIEETVDKVTDFERVAIDLGVSPTTISLIKQRLEISKKAVLETV